MKKSTLNPILTLIGLVAATAGTYFLARLFMNPSSFEPPPVFSTYYGEATPIPFPSPKPKIAGTLSGRIHTFAVSPDMKTIAFATSEGIVLYDLQSYKYLRTLNDTENAFSVAWSPNGSRMVATGDLGYGFRRWRIDTDESVRLYDNRASAFAVQLKWSPDGERIASIHADGEVCFWTVSTNHCDGFIKAHPTSAFSLAWSPEGNRIATGGGIIRIWDVQNGKLITSFGLNDGNGPIYSELQWLANNTLASLETGHADQELTIVRFWEIDTGKIMMEFHGASSAFGE